MALIADNIVVFLFRLFRWAILRARSAHWTKTDAIIRTAGTATKSMYPCAEITYAYKVKFERYEGRYTRGFWYRDSAEDFAKRFVPSERLIIRYRRDRPEKSYLFEEDQPW